MSSLLSGLNDEQKRAVTISRNHHTLVLAGAGCGKTTVLTHRIAYLAANEIPQEKILALTFTRKAAQEMLERVKMLKQIDSDKQMPQITTFHGFALKLLATRIDGKTNFERIGFKCPPIILEYQKRLEILSQITDKNIRAALDSDLIKLDNLLSQFVVLPKRLELLSNEQKILLQSIIDKYQAVKLNQGLWDFSDLLSGALKLCKDNPNVVKRTLGSFEAVLVDEFQDTNPLQISFLNCFVNEQCSLFAVGDDDQAIYGFRGADIGPTINFTSYFDGAVIVKLQTNYRSKPLILETANKIFANKSDIYKKVLVSGRYGNDNRGVKPQKCMFTSQEQMASWIMRVAEQLSIQSKVDVSEMAVLFRVNQTCNFMEKLVQETFPQSNWPQFLTVHRSKGLEYPVVFLCDLEEGVFPSYRISSGKNRVNSFVNLVKTLTRVRNSPDNCDFEEEKRLFYVGVTRAKEHLYLLSCGNKMLYGRLRRFERSRFLKLV